MRARLPGASECQRDRLPIRETNRERRSAGLRRRQEGQGTQASHPDDTTGPTVGAAVHAADIQDRDGAPAVLASVRSAFPWLRHVFADDGYPGEKLRTALDELGR